MKAIRTPEQISARQVYEVWSSEPELLRIIDLRESESFASSRIPGSQWVDDAKKITALAAEAPDILFVLVTEKGNFEKIEALRFPHNVVELGGGFEKWSTQGLPLCPQDRNQLREKFQKGTPMTQDILFYQLFEPETSTYTYLLADRASREAVLIDPVLETVDRDLKLIEEHGFRLLYVLDTHIHADHVTGAGEIRKRTGAKTGVSAHAKVNCADLALEDGQELRFGRHTLRVLETPGHTDSCLSFYCEGRVFTGDALLIRGTGRTDFQQGSPEKLYRSITDRLFTLPPETVVYPGHDYRGQTSSSIEMEMKHNARIGGGKTLAQFTETMKELQLAHPKKIHEAVPANLACGKKSADRVFIPQTVGGVPEITPQDLHAHLGETLMIDVRRPDEFNNELGHVPGSKLVTLGDELASYLSKVPTDQEIVFICRSGARSGRATEECLRMGFKKVVNMQGGMILWNDLKLPVEREEGGR